MRSRVFDGENEIVSEINIIPLVDISLVLLIIFMVTANYVMTSYIKVDMPKAQYAKAGQFQDVLQISVSSEGIVYFEDKPVTGKELKSKIQQYSRTHKDPEVVLSADKAADFKSVVSVIDALSELNITKVNIATVEETQ